MLASTPFCRCRRSARSLATLRSWRRSVRHLSSEASVEANSSCTKEPGHRLAPKIGHFRPFNPAADREKMNVSERIEEDMHLLHTQIGEVDAFLDTEIEHADTLPDRRSGCASRRFRVRCLGIARCTTTLASSSSTPPIRSRPTSYSIGPAGSNLYTPAAPTLTDLSRSPRRRPTASSPPPRSGARPRSRTTIGTWRAYGSV